MAITPDLGKWEFNENTSQACLHDMYEILFYLTIVIVATIWEKWKNIYTNSVSKMIFA